MSSVPASPTTAGQAFRVTIMGQEAEAYERVYVQLDAQFPVVHVFSTDAQTHYLTIPLASALIEWEDPAPLQPFPRLPAYGPGAFERFGEHAQRIAEGVGRAFGHGSPHQNP